jgi:plastocyanin domain-containing protein
MLLGFMVVFTTTASAQKTRGGSQSARVEITRYGYEPVSIALRKGIPARITFVRRTNDTCATEVLFPDYGINRNLPLDQAVVISFTPRKTGEFAFTCGMRMHKGRMIVR